MTEYSVEICETLAKQFRGAGLHRPMRVQRYDAGMELVYNVTTVATRQEGTVRVVVDKFVGGGFAGQVYKVKILQITSEQQPVEKLGDLEVGSFYAIKILIPPSAKALAFRNILYGLGFQGPFQLQVNPAAARAGALWQKFIRRGAQIHFGAADVVVDIYATFIDETLGSCAELSQWVEGRTWRLEVDEHLDTLKRWRRKKPVNIERLGSHEYRAKHEFMHRFVELLHEMGGHEFARQYEWSTCKSQPNCLKRHDSPDDPADGLVAVDFRAGLALLPFLPMSPGDFKLIFNGLKRGSLVQFDRGSLTELEKFINDHGDNFADMTDMLQELKAAEYVYRNSIPDITHNHIRLFYSRKLWRTILDSTVTGWKTRNIIDEPTEQKMRNNKFSILMFAVIGLIPFLGRFIRRIWARPDWRKHYKNFFADFEYFFRALQARLIEKTITWHRTGRIDAHHAPKVARSILLGLCHLPLSVLPAGLHRFLTDWAYTKERLVYIFARPARLYFNAKLREQWLRDMVAEGQKKHILTDDDADIILSQVNEPFIQKYLKSLAVHVCTLPVTQIVSVIVAIVFYIKHPDMPEVQRKAAVAGILILFQVIPISPGSICRGLYVLYLVIREKNFKDYNIAVFLGFFKYVGYLAFPIQMTYHYPALARFMAGHWATEIVHIVPVFGERGALLEHWIYSLFYNQPLTIRRRMQRRAEIRTSVKPRLWHAGLCAVVAAGVFALADFIYLKHTAQLPSLKDTWWLATLVPLICGAVVTLGCGGVILWKRIVTAAACGGVVGILYTASSVIIACSESLAQIAPGQIAAECVWRIFVFSILAVIGTIVTELKLPDPDLGRM